MLLIVVSAVLCTTLIHVSSAATAGLEYNQGHNLDGTSRGFYSYLDSNTVQTHFPTHMFGEDSINLFSGQPLGSTHRKNLNFEYRTSNTFQPTTLRPTVDYTKPNLENEVFTLPTPTIQHYEKIWPLPPIRFKDLEIRVNGKDLYDPRPRYNDLNGFATPQFAKTIQNTAQFTGMPQPIHPLQSSSFHNPPTNQLSESARLTNENEVYKPHYVLQPVSFESTNNLPEVPKEAPQYNLGPQQTTLQSLTFNDATQLSPSFPPTNNIEPDFSADQFQQPKMSGPTAHQIELLNYKQRTLANSNVPNNDFENQKINYYPKINTTPKNNNNRNAKNPITKIVVRKSHVGVEKNIVTLAARRAFDEFKAKYNLS